MNAFREPSAAELQVTAKLNEGYTVYLGAAQYKIKHGESTLEFTPFMRQDAVSGRFRPDGAWYATQDAEEIKRIDSTQAINVKKFEPKK